MRLFDIPVGVAYALCMGIAGNVLIGIGDMLVDLAADVQETSVSSKLQCLFLVRGVGQLVATPLAAELFSSFHGHGLLLACLAAIAVLWCVCSWIGSVWLLYMWFLATGLLTATLDTGVQILTRRHYKHRAGPWLTTNTLMFASAGLVSPLISYATSSTAQVSYVYASFALVSAGVVLVTCDHVYLWPTLLDASSLHKSGVEGASEGRLWAFFSSQFSLEWHMAAVVFLLIGGQNVYSSYVITFVQESGALSSTYSDALLSVFWAATVLSRLLALSSQLDTTPRRLLRGIVSWCGLAVLASLPLYMVAEGVSGKAWWLWLCTAVYGAAIGPVLGYLFDAHNRLSTASERGSAVLIFGLNLGTSVVPWLFVALWDVGGGTLAFPIILGLAPGLGLVLTARLYQWAKQARPGALDMSNDELQAHMKAQASCKSDDGDEEDSLLAHEDAPPPLTHGARQRKFTAQALAALYMVVVTAFYFLSSSYPSLYSVQFSSGDDCYTPGYYCASPYEGEEASVLAFYVFLWGLGLWGICRIHNQSWRIRTERLVYFPLLGWRTSLRELCLLLATATLTAFWVVYYFTQLGSRASGVERLNLTLGHLNDLLLSLLLLLTARASVWDYLLGVSYEQGIVYHAWLGTLAFATISAHLGIWWILWLQEGEWLEEAWLRVSDPNVNLMTGSECTLAQTLLATCGNGHFWAIPAIEAWYWLLGVPTLGVLAFYPIRSSYYQAFYYGHHQFVLFLPIAYYHSWGLWKYATVGLVLWALSRLVVSQIRASRELVVKKLEHHPGGVTFLELERADGKPLEWQTAGQFVWLNIPFLDALEWHPFSISSAPCQGPSWTHHIKAVPPSPCLMRRVAEQSEGGGGAFGARYNEWTQRLHAIAEDASATKHIRVWYDGPYGVAAFHPEDGDVHDVVFVAGGIGVTNPLSYLLQAVDGHASPSKASPVGRERPRLHLIWVVRSRESLSAFAPQLLTLLSADTKDLHVHIYETRSTPSSGESTPLLVSSPDSAPEHSAFLAHLKTRPGRPDLYKLLEEISSSFSGSHPDRERRMAVVACGPEALIQSAELAAVELGRNKDHVSLFFHAEAFAL